MFPILIWNGCQGRKSIRPRPVTEHRRPKTLQWVSIFMSSAPWQLTNTAVCVYARILNWRETRHKWCSSLTASLYVIEWFSILVEYCNIGEYGIDCHLSRNNFQWFLIPREDYSFSCGYIAFASVDKWRPENYVYCGVLTIPREGLTCRSSMQVNNGTMSSMLTTSRFAVSSCCECIDLKGSF